MKFRKNERTKTTIKNLLNVFLILLMGCIFYYFWQQFYHLRVYFWQRGNWLLCAMFMTSLACFNSIYGGFRLGEAKKGDLIFSQIISLCFTNFLLFIIVGLINKGFLPVRGFAVMLCVEAIVTVFVNYVVQVVYYKLFPPQKTIMIYGRKDDSVYDRMLKTQYANMDLQSKIRFSVYEQDMHVVDGFECILAVGLNVLEKELLLKECYENSKTVLILPDVYDILLNGSTSMHLIDTPLLRLNKFGPTQVQKIWKRLFDIVFALIMLVLTSPFMLITAIAIKIEDGGPCFYKQIRTTQYGRDFGILKFRSMKIDAEKDGVARLASEHDDRITKVGHFIRACRIDELPQLINILVGDMSVVGPRPERPELIEKILLDVPEFNYRLKVKAGLTGYAQVYGKYNTRLRDKLLYDLMYIENFSLFMDLKIIFLTFKILFVKESTEGVSEAESK